MKPAINKWNKSNINIKIKIKVEAWPLEKNIGIRIY